jgi:hypothetical protein
MALALCNVTDSDVNVNANAKAETESVDVGVGVGVGDNVEIRVDETGYWSIVHASPSHHDVTVDSVQQSLNDKSPKHSAAEATVNSAIDSAGGAAGAGDEADRASGMRGNSDNGDTAEETMFLDLTEADDHSSQLSLDNQLSPSRAPDAQHIADTETSAIAVSVDADAGVEADVGVGVEAGGEDAVAIDNDVSTDSAGTSTSKNTDTTAVNDDNNVSESSLWDNIDAPHLSDALSNIDNAVTDADAVFSDADNVISGVGVDEDVDLLDPNDDYVEADSLPDAKADAEAEAEAAAQVASIGASFDISNDPLKNATLRRMDDDASRERHNRAVAMALLDHELSKCPLSMDRLPKHSFFTDLIDRFMVNQTKFLHQHVSDSVVEFFMMPNDYHTVSARLDDIRTKQPKFICINDDVHGEPDQRVFDALSDFYDSYFPVPSPFELPQGVYNADLHVTLPYVSTTSTHSDTSSSRDIPHSNSYVSHGVSDTGSTAIHVYSTPRRRAHTLAIACLLTGVVIGTVVAAAAFFILRRRVRVKEVHED